MSDRILVDWDGRPAISFSVTEALAILTPGGSWTAVDGPDVFNTGRVIPDENAFISLFERNFGSFPIPATFKNEEKEEEMMQEEEMPMDAAEEVEMDAEEEVEGELPVPAPEEDEAEEAEDSEAIARQVIDAVAGALRDTLNVDIEVEGSEEEMEVEMEKEEPEMEMPEMEMEKEEEAEEETEVMEALSEIEYVPSQQEIVEQVAKRVANRLLKAKKAQAELNEALGLNK